MNRRPLDDLSSLSMAELFRVEAESQTAILTAGLLELEKAARPTTHSGPQNGPASPQNEFETLMRAAHSLKGAARIINLQVVVKVAHALEDCFVAAQQGKLRLDRPHIDILLKGVDLLIQLCK